MPRNVSFAPTVLDRTNGNKKSDDNGSNGQTEDDFQENDDYNNNNDDLNANKPRQPSNNNNSNSSTLHNSLFCPNCGSRSIDSNAATGASTCTDCGVIVEENAIVSAVEFVEGAGGASSMVGQFVSGSSSKAYNSTGARWGFSRDSRETTLANGRRRIQEVASRLRLSSHFVDGAHRLFTIAVEKNFVKGRRTTHVVAACLYMACRQEKSQHMLIDFSDALQINVYVLGSCFLKFRRLLGLPIELMDPALYIYRFAAHLYLPELSNDGNNDNNDNNSNDNDTSIVGGRHHKSRKTVLVHTISLTALRLIARMKRDWMVTGRRPAGICAAALLLSARVHGYEHVDVSRILCVCDATVQARVRELEQTPTAKMTLPELMALPLDEDGNAIIGDATTGVYNQGDSTTDDAALGGSNQGTDPPIFVRNKILEARAKALRVCNTELLDSGLLDNPYMNEKFSAKWRQAKRKFKAAQMDTLYTSLAQELEATVGGFSPENDDTQDSNNDGNDNVNNNQQDETREDNQVDREPDPPADPDKIDKVSKAIVPVVNKVIENVPPHLEHAYPKITSGRALILPQEATAEELQISIVPNEGQVSLVKWKESMPDNIKQEIDDLFRSEQEELTREAMFYQLHGDYNATPAAPRVSKKQKRDPKKSTEEHLRDAVSTRKVSRKINYDALSSIFDDSGDFDNGGTAEAPETGYEETF